MRRRYCESFSQPSFTGTSTRCTISVQRMLRQKPPSSAMTKNPFLTSHLLLSVRAWFCRSTCLHHADKITPTSRSQFVCDFVVRAAYTLLTESLPPPALSCVISLFELVDLLSAVAVERIFSGGHDTVSLRQVSSLRLSEH